MLRGLHFSHAYIDVLIASSSAEEHAQHLQAVLEHFQQYGVIINPEKCELGANTLQFWDNKLTVKASNYWKLK